MAVTVFFTDGRVEAYPAAGMAMRSGAEFRVVEIAPPDREVVRIFGADEVSHADVSGRLNYTARGLGQQPAAELDASAALDLDASAEHVTGYTLIPTSRD